MLGVERFVQEIETTANLQHPHILPLFDSGEPHGFLYYVMPYVEGETLRDRLNRETQLGIEEAVRITMGEKQQESTCMSDLVREPHSRLASPAGPVCRDDCHERGCAIRAIGTSVQRS